MLEDLFSQTPSLQLFIEEVKKTSSMIVEHLWDTPKALLSLILHEKTKKNLLILSGKKESRLLDCFPFFSDKEVLDLPPWESLVGEEPQANFDIMGKRMQILHKLASREKKKPCIVYCPMQSLMQKVPSVKTLSALCHLLTVGQKAPFATLPDLLVSLGYTKTSVTSDKGDFSVRGGLLDIFPIAAEQPYRIDFFGDEIESIRTFDPVSQKSIEKVEKLFLCPTSEWELLKKEKKPATILDYLGPDIIVIFDDLLTLEDEYVELQSRLQIRAPFLFSLEELLDKLPSYTHLFFLEHTAEELSEVVLKERKGRKFHSGTSPFQPMTLSVFHREISSCRFNHPFLEVSSFFSRFENKATATEEEIFLGIHASADTDMQLFMIADNAAEEKRMKDQIKMQKIALPKQTHFIQGYLPSGFVIQSPLIAYVPTPELTHRYKMRRQKWRNTYHAAASEFHELTPGDTIVHLHHGIGRYLGTDNRPNHLGQDTEYLKIEYAKDSQLYVPVSQSHLVNRYIGVQEEKPTLSLLGAPKWQKTLVEAQGAIVGYAKQLLDQMAQRSLKGGFCFPKDSDYMQMFEEEFPFPMTEDQTRAVSAIKEDMCSDKAMDRLICGDVGYGKTEVAMRAAFKAVCDGKKQVVVLVPTTILAMQHYETFKSRMANFPVQIALLSRFSSVKQTKEILKKAKDGTIDILIGTHRLLNKDLSFKDLGLLIIDEEQRFGVRVKEHLKKLKNEVECLTLSATPIPRTLYMSLIGIREISEISTPPQDRLPIKSVIVERNSDLIKNALIREFSRDGQAFFIHNRVETLPRICDELQKLVPEARIAMGHGQMDADEIDTVFQSFKQGESDLLLSTTIVENGIDIPNANTIFIDRADLFGMADLYQLRGRVGRWNRPAYAYFLVPSNTALPEVSRKRLQTLVDNSGYGSGLKIALRDLEIRGAGDILGEQQSGQVSAIGFHLYCKLLKKAVEALKKQTPLQFFETRIEFFLDAKVPEDYIDEPAIRMEIYYRLGNTSSAAEVQEVLNEIQDRFGVLPRPLLLLGLFSRIRIFASALQIHSLKFEKFTLHLEKTIGKKTVKDTLPLPKMHNLELFETGVLKLLKEWRPKV